LDTKIEERTRAELRPFTSVPFPLLLARGWK
jgi:hypothetical protein